MQGTNAMDGPGSHGLQHPSTQASSADAPARGLLAGRPEAGRWAHSLPLAPTRSPMQVLDKYWISLQQLGGLPCL